MKKYFTLSNCLKACAALLGLVAFFLMFANQLYAEVLGSRGYVEFSDAMFGDYGSVITFVGYLLFFLSAAGACALTFLGMDAKTKKYASLGLAFLFVLAAIFVFIEAGVVNGRLDASMYHLSAAPVIAGILGILAGLAVALSEFVPDKALLK